MPPVRPGRCASPRRRVETRVPFAITPGLEAVWGFKPSLEEMRRRIRVFTFNESSVNDDLARLRLRAATRPGVHEAYASMFPAPRQDMVNAMALDETVIAALPHDTLIIHGRDDLVTAQARAARRRETGVARSRAGSPPGRGRARCGA